MTAALPWWRARERDRPLVGVLPGDGIGPEVIDVTLAVLEAAAPEVEVRRGGPIGVAARESLGCDLPPEVEDWCTSIFAEEGALLCGPGGGRFVYDLRRRFDLFCKLTPVRPMPALADAGPVRWAARREADLVVVREGAGGIYLGESRLEGDEARHELVYREHEVRRIVDAGVRLAEARSGRIAVALKPGGLPALSELWSAVLDELAGGAGLDARVVEVDNLAYQLIAAAGDLDVIVAPNLFGDILSDAAALLLGSRGLSFSASYAPSGAAAYQTGHGAAHDIAGRDTANPIAQILSAAMMLRESFGLDEAADVIEGAVTDALGAGIRTADIAPTEGTHRVVGTRAMGQEIIERVATAATTREVPS